MSERDFRNYEKLLDDASRIVLPGTYRHYNNGKHYQFEKLSIDKETEKVRVGYHDICHPAVSLSVELETWREFVASKEGPIRRFTWLPGLELILE